MRGNPERDTRGSRRNLSPISSMKCQRLRGIWALPCQSVLGEITRRYILELPFSLPSLFTVLGDPIGLPVSHYTVFPLIQALKFRLPFHRTCKMAEDEPEQDRAAPSARPAGSQTSQGTLSSRKTWEPRRLSVLPKVKHLQMFTGLLQLCILNQSQNQKRKSSSFNLPSIRSTHPSIQAED